MQTTERRPAPRAGLIRRLFERPGPGNIPSLGAPDILDLESPDLPEELVRRIDRLEAGMRVLAETMKRTYASLATAIDEVRSSSSDGPTPPRESPRGEPAPVDDRPDPLTALRRERFAHLGDEVDA